MLKHLLQIILCCFLVESIPYLFADSVDELQKKIDFEQKHFPKGDLADKAYVLMILSKMAAMDQEIREKVIKDFKEQWTDPKVGNLLVSMDQFHTTKMKEILKCYGWITISQFGEVADDQAWTLIQHADADPFFQAGCLFVLSKLIDQGETSKKNYAYLYDRVALKFPMLGMKQRYGTQVTVSNNEVTILPYEGSLQELNQKRHEAGIESEEEYLEVVKKAYLQ